MDQDGGENENNPAASPSWAANNKRRQSTTAHGVDEMQHHDGFRSSTNRVSMRTTTSFEATSCQTEGSMLKKNHPARQQRESEAQYAGRLVTGSDDRHEKSDGCASSKFLPACMQKAELQRLMRDAPEKPPVTIDTLKELDLWNIQNNVSLRVDVNYDYDLHFMPISGRRGEEKRAEAKFYWRALEVELQVYQHVASGGCKTCRGAARDQSIVFQQKLPTMFLELKALLLVLVPEKDHDEVELMLDISLLMQEITHGVLDITKLSTWLSKLLTNHCAPVRDEWADQFSQTLESGANSGDMASIVDGLEKLFSFCEAMKLDVANHQIRTFRVPLIEDGISFQRNHFRWQLEKGKLDIGPSQKWFEQVRVELGAPAVSIERRDALAFGLVHVSCDPSQEIPDTFQYDIGRIEKIRDEVQDIIHLELSCSLSTEVYAQIPPSFRRRCDIASMHSFVKKRVMDITDGGLEIESDATTLWSIRSEPVSFEITRSVFHVACLSPRIPDKAFSFTDKRLKHHIQQEAEGRQQARKTSQDLLPLVTGHMSRFQGMSALEISEEQKRYQASRQTLMQNRCLPELDDISRRLAHMLVIHWKVWEHLAYS